MDAHLQIGLVSTYGKSIDVVSMAIGGTQGYVVAGGIQVTNTNRDALVMHLDNTGTVVGRNATIAKTTTALKKRLASKPGLIQPAICGTSDLSNPDAAPNYAYVFKLSGTGTVTWANRYGFSISDISTNSVYTKGIIQNPSTGDLTVTGNFFTTSGRGGICFA